MVSKSSLESQSHNTDLNFIICIYVIDYDKNIIFIFYIINVYI
jgi:hypothetical protein